MTFALKPLVCEASESAGFSTASSAVGRWTINATFLSLQPGVSIPGHFQRDWATLCSVTEAQRTDKHRAMSSVFCDDSAYRQGVKYFNLRF